MDKILFSGNSSFSRLRSPEDIKGDLEKLRAFVLDIKKRVFQSSFVSDFCEEDLFLPEVFDFFKKMLGITLPFILEKKEFLGERNGKNIFDYSLSLPLVEGYFWHRGKDRDIDIGTTWSFVSRDAFDPETGFYGTPVVKDDVGEWDVWCEVYGEDLVSQEMRILTSALDALFQIDSLRRKVCLHNVSSFENALLFSLSERE